MRLTLRDAATLPFMAAIIALYTAHLNGADGWPASGVRSCAVAVFVLGTVGGCALGRGSELFEGEATPAVALYRVLVSWLGIFAFLGGGVALVAASEAALAVLFGTTIALWVLSTTRHALAGRPAAAGPRTHGTSHVTR